MHLLYKKLGLLLKVGKYFNYGTIFGKNLLLNNLQVYFCITKDANRQFQYIPEISYFHCQKWKLKQTLYQNRGSQ